MQLDRVAHKLVQTGATIDAARGLVSSVSADVRQAAFADLPGFGDRAGEASGPKALIRGPLMITTSEVDSSPPFPQVPQPPTRTPRRLPPAVIATMSSSKPLLTGKRFAAGAHADRSPAGPSLLTPGDAAVGRPSVPDVTPRIIGLIRKGKN